MCGPDSAEVHRVDLDAGHQLGFLDRLLDRIDRGLEVDDHAAADAARLGNAEADDVEAVRRSMISPTTAGHLRGADVEPDQVSLLSRQLNFPRQARQACATCLLPPSGFRLPSFCASSTLPPSSACVAPGGPHVDAIVEAQIHVIDVGHALA